MNLTKGEQFLVRKQKKDYTAVWMMIVAIFLVSVLLNALVDILVPPAASAQPGPMTNRDVCKLVKDGGYLPPAGHVGDMVKLCSRLGISI